MSYKRNICDKLALGYGSKYQLLRMLGWHRNYFDRLIKNQTNNNLMIDYIDFKFNGPEDKEWLNASFVSDELNNKWKSLWACGSNGGINWDLIGMQDDTYLLFEAKAHVKELESSMDLTTKSSVEKNEIAIKQYKDKYNIASTSDWKKMSYQLANRLVFLDFINEELKPVNKKAKLVYVLFINGYEFNCDNTKSVKSTKVFDNAIDKELEYLGITREFIKDKIYFIYPDCNQK